MRGIIEKRQSSRYPSIARVKIPHLFTGEALLKDISVTGCCIECTMQVAAEINSLHTITVYPEKNAGIGNFDLIVECRWVHSGASSCSIGLAVKQSPGRKDFLKYVDYLSWRCNI